MFETFKYLDMLETRFLIRVNEVQLLNLRGFNKWRDSSGEMH
jgi:hypothetical protein